MIDDFVALAITVAGPDPAEHSLLEVAAVYVDQLTDAESLISLLTRNNVVHGVLQHKTVYGTAPL